MKITITLLLILAFQASSAQETSRKVNHLRNGDKEVFYVLKSNNDVRHGKYEKRGKYIHVIGYYKNGKRDSIWTEYSLQNRKFLRLQSNYKDGLKDGLWIAYLSKNKLQYRGHYGNDKRAGAWKFYNQKGEIEQTGYYTNGNRTGVWTFYNNQGDVDQEYNYTSKELISDISLAGLKEKKFKVIDGIDTTLRVLQRPPVYIGGQTKMRFTKHRWILIKEDSLKAEVSFVITKTGGTRDYRIIRSTGGYVYDEEAIKTVVQLSSDWLPAIVDGQAMDTEYTLTVLFKKINKTIPIPDLTPLSSRIGDNVENPFLYHNPHLKRNTSTTLMTTMSLNTCQIEIR